MGGEEMNKEKKEALLTLLYGFFLNIPCIVFISEQWYVRVIGFIWSWFMCSIIFHMQDKITELKQDYDELKER